MNELIKENVEGTGDLFPPELIVFLIVARRSTSGGGENLPKPGPSP
jgi:hypothetical protein